jgi:hypothetical protein
MASQRQAVTPGKHRILRDIRSDMAEWELMRKYKISARGLESVYKKLIDAKLLTANYTSPSECLYVNSVVLDLVPSLQRTYFPFELPIFEAAAPHNRGLVHDMTKSDIGILGMMSKLYEEKTFAILPNEYAPIFPITFRAVCSCIRSESKDGSFFARFEIKDHNFNASSQLEKLMIFGYMSEDDVNTVAEAY